MQRKACPTPTILVTGSNGQVGFELRRSLASLGRVVALGRADCNLLDLDAVRAQLRRWRPDVIVNAAAYTDVDEAESDADTAFAVNGVAPGVMAEEARALGSLLVHYSTDYVFPGTGDRPHTETDAVGPSSVYGKSKLAGEQAIAQVDARAIVLRTSWVAGVYGHNFVRTILELGRTRDVLRVIDDQIGAPTTASLIADVTARIIDRQWLHADRALFPVGIYHLAASGETSWHGYAKAVLSQAANCGAKLKIDAAHIQAVASGAFPQVATRPRNSRLDTRKLSETFDIFLPAWQVGIEQLIEQIFFDTEHA